MSDAFPEPSSERTQIGLCTAFAALAIGGMLWSRRKGLGLKVPGARQTQQPQPGAEGVWQSKADPYDHRARRG